MFELSCPGRQCVQNEILSGLTVALALVPEAVAFAFVAGVDPLVGLYAAFMMGLITAVLGGRPGMISGATGAMAVVMVALVAQHGVQYLFAAVILTGLFQILAGIFRLGKFIRLVPYPVMLGFVNGLAIVIFMAQLKQFKATDSTGTLTWLSGTPLITMLVLVGLTMLTIHYLPKLTTAIPASLVAIVAITLLVIALNLDTITVQDALQNMTGDPSATIAGGLPVFNIPMVPLTLETLHIILPYAIILAAVGLIESLLTVNLIDELTETRGRGNKECIGQGVANTVNGFFGGMGGCAMIGQSLINIRSGGKQRLSGISAALFLLAFIVFASKLIEIIPIAALVGVMFIVVIATFEWASLRLLGKVPMTDVVTVILVAAITVFFDLAIAVIIGVIFSALVFAWEHAKQMTAKAYINDMGFKVYELSGPLFFGSVQNFNELFTPDNDPETVIVDFYDSRVADHSGLEAIDSLAERYQRRNKNLRLKHLSTDCKKLLHKAGKLVEENDQEDPFYYVAVSNPS